MSDKNEHLHCLNTLQTCTDALSQYSISQGQSCQLLVRKPNSPTRLLLLISFEVIPLSQRIPLLRHTLLSPLTRCLSLVALSLHLLLQDTLTLLLGFSLVDLRVMTVSDPLGDLA